MADKTGVSRPRLPSTTMRQASGGVFDAATLGVGLLLLATACIGVVYWTPDLAVRAGATLLGMTLGASGIITPLAGNP